MRKILITGANGGIGSRLLGMLRREGYASIGTDREGVHGIPADLLNGTDINRLFRLHPDIHTVIHCAGKAHEENVRNEREYFLNNVQGTQTLFEASRKAEIKQFIFLSTLEVYDPAAFMAKVTEDSPCRPVTAYGKSKAEAEQYLLANAGPVQVVIFRLAPVYATDLLKDLLKRILLPGNLFVYRCQWRKPRFSLCHISTLARAVTTVFDLGAVPFTESFIFNVADREAYSQSQLFELAGVKNNVWGGISLSQDFLWSLFDAASWLFPGRRDRWNWTCHKISESTLMDTSSLQKYQDAIPMQPPHPAHQVLLR